MVDAGRVVFKVELDRSSLDRQLASLERRLTQVGDVDLKVSNQAATTAVRGIDRLFANIRVPEINFRVNTDPARQSVDSLSTEILDLETAIASFSNSRNRIDLDVKRGEASLARIEAQVERLQQRRISIPLVTPDAANKIRAIEAQLESLSARRVVVEANTEQARTQLSQLDRTLEDLSGDNAQQTLDRLNQELRETAQAAKSASDSGQTFNSVLAGFAAGAANQLLDRLIDAFGQLTQKVFEFVGASIQANQQLRATENALSIVLGSQEAAAESIEFLREVSIQTGQSFQALQGEYSGLTAAAAEAGVPQEEINGLFAETSRVLAIFGKDSQSTGLAFNALTQIASKGVVSMEELRQQLGEQLPVAFGATARGLGITTAELNDLVASGELTAAKFIPAFTRGLAEIEGEAPAAQQAIAALENQILELQFALGAAIEPLETGFSETFAQIFDGVNASSLNVLAEAGERLRESLEDNPELAERLGEALNNFVGSGAEAVATILDRISQALANPDNVEAFAEGLEATGQSIVDLADAIVQLTNLLGTLGDTIQKLPALDSLFGDIAPTRANSGSLVDRLENLIQGEGFTASPEIGVSFVPQQDELDKEVRAAADASKQIADDAEREARRAAAERIKANEEAVAEFKRSNEQALADLETAQNNRIAGVRQNQAAGSITADQADSQIADIEAQSIQERLALREQEITQIEALEERGALSAEDAAKKITEARQSVSELTLEAVEAEISAQKEAEEAAKRKAEEAQKAALAQLSAQQELNQLQAEQINIQTGLASTALQDQATLIGAQVSLEQSRLSLSRQTLEAKVAEAQAAEDVVAVEALRDQILVNQRQSIAAEFDARRRQLQIQQQLNQLDADRRVRLAEIAEAESRIAVERARLDDDSTQEQLTALEEIVRLREQETEAVASQARTQGDVLALQLEQLDTDQAIAEQRAQTERREQAIESLRKQQKDLADEQLETERDLASATQDRERAIDSIVSSLGSLEDVSAEDALAQLDTLEQNLRSARRGGAIGNSEARDLQRAIDRAQSFSSGGFTVDEAFRFASQNENNPFANGILDSLGLGGASDLFESQQEIALAESQITALTSKLEEVKEAVSEIPDNLPPTIQTLNINSEQPVADAAEIAFNLSKERIRQGGG